MPLKSPAIWVCLGRRLLTSWTVVPEAEAAVDNDGYRFISLSSRSTNLGHDIVTSLTRFPLGHHLTLPRPIIRTPSSVLPLRTSKLKELLLFLFVSSTVEA